MAGVLLRAAASGAEITRLKAEPLQSVSCLRHAVVAAGYGGPKELFCGLRLLLGTQVLRDSETLEASGLAGGGTVDVVRIPSLELWRDGRIVWATIKVPVSGPIGADGVEVKPVGRDRLLTFPACAAWRDYDDSLGESALEDSIGKYEVMHFGASDLWLVGASEPIATEGSVPGCSGYVSKRQLSLPLSDPSQAIHAFRFQGDLATVLLGPGESGDAMEDFREGSVQNFRLCGIEEDDFWAVHFEPDGFPAPLRFKFPGVREGDPIRASYTRLVRNFDFEDGDLAGKKPTYGAAGSQHTLGLDRCGRIVADLLHFEKASPFTMKISELQDDDDGSDPQVLATWQAEGHVNHRVQAMGDQLLLFAGLKAGEDAFYKNMRLLDSKTGSTLREIPLEIMGFGYIESGWPRGILFGSTQTFFTSWRVEEDFSNTHFAFATPEM